MQKASNDIAIIDSGIGGISVLNKLLDKFHKGNYIYFADNLFMPYGNKSKHMVRLRIESIVKMLKENYNPKQIIIACNTASSCIKNKDKQLVTMQFNKSDVFLSTKLTAKNLNLKNSIWDRTLASQIEKNILNNNKLNEIIKKHSVKLKLNNHKQVVLGCTHFELVKKLFEKYNKGTCFVDNSERIIDKIQAPLNDELNIVFLQSKKSEKMLETMKRLTKHTISSC